jgi:hypothetical protein
MGSALRDQPALATPKTDADARFDITVPTHSPTRPAFNRYSSAHARLLHATTNTRLLLVGKRSVGRLPPVRREREHDDPCFGRVAAPSAKLTTTPETSFAAPGLCMCPAQTHSTWVIRVRQPHAGNRSLRPVFCHSIPVLVV